MRSPIAQKTRFPPSFCLNRAFGRLLVRSAVLGVRCIPQSGCYALWVFGV